jgi:hypothetical protein
VFLLRAGPASDFAVIAASFVTVRVFELLGKTRFTVPKLESIVTPPAVASR